MKCEIKYYSYAPHLSQIITGFILLKQKNIIDNLTIINCVEGSDAFFNPLVLDVTINDEIHIAFDMNDGYNFDINKFDNYIKRVDYYFKRSFSIEKNKNLYEKEKIFPLSFNYFVSIKGNPLTKIQFNRTLESCQRYIRGKRVDIKKFQKSNKITKDIKILFLTRCWENEKEINNFRAECIRSLKKNFGDRVIAGFQESSLAKKCYPDCVINKKYTKKSKYIKLMKECSICITTIGLHFSNGWKLGEYVSQGKAIITEKMIYEVNGNFNKGDNYLEFESPDELVDQVNKILSNKKYMKSMMNKNNEYYRMFLAPDKVVFNALKKIKGMD